MIYRSALNKSNIFFIHVFVLRVDLNDQRMIFASLLETLINSIHHSLLSNTVECKIPQILSIYCTLEHSSHLYRVYCKSENTVHILFSM